MENCLHWLAEGSLLGRRQALFEVVRQGLYGLNESGDLAVADDAWQGRVVEGDSGGYSLFTAKGTSAPRLSTKVSVRGKRVRVGKDCRKVGAVVLCSLQGK